ncbi:hypothetical protein EW146_g4987 [Bondarzewia mesenterica]|uniref:Uncharacterized protein n=1 Tax=Bondarzewia mesenterica TaxID=1095465 RepID=A0A4S4LTW0_9AGAM|nr:hypothetical protein EW146_g4987 [Bondarzewia mesenterica]
MSHLTSSPFHKPSPFDVPRHAQLPTPPDTEPDFVGVTQAHTTLGPGAEVEPSTLQANLVPDAHGSRFRRVSTLSYRNTGIRDSRDRSGSGHSKWLIVVMPPASVSKMHGQLGHTLASGPPERLSQGILMPLFPTMYGQLTVIAREFNFPSIAGLCVYLHLTENGLHATPRISDETWPLLWSHLLEARSPTLQIQQLPVCGRVEFDIDLNKARWYDAWVSSSRRHVMDLPVSAAPSISHGRGDSKTTFLEDQLPDEPSESLSVLFTRTPVPGSRHVPRKLSLIDRLDTNSIGSGLISNTARIEDSTETRALAPIVQGKEPKLVTKDLESRVKSWRASSSVVPTPLAATGQTSLDPVHMPNDFPLNESLMSAEAAQEGELNLDDFAWSVSSFGPATYDDIDSPMSWDRIQSVHLDRRLEGSVLLSPSTATSFGPDDDLISLVSFASRRPSPDIALRMLEDVPPTPSTATSWGPPLDYPPSPVTVPRAPSVDLACRSMFSRPGTPTTATSWGPSSWPATPRHYDDHSSHISLDVGERGGWSQPVTPLTATSWGAPLSYPPSPSIPEPIPTPDAGQRAFDPASPHPANSFESLFPYSHAEESTTWHHVWPFNREEIRDSNRSMNAGQRAIDLALQHPRDSSEFMLPYHSDDNFAWHHVWPFNREEIRDSNPSMDAGQRVFDSAPQHPRDTSEFVFPYYKPDESSAWHHVWPFNREEIRESSRNSDTSQLPFVFPYYRPEDKSVWQHVWPFNGDQTAEIPKVQVNSELDQHSMTHASSIGSLFSLTSRCLVLRKVLYSEGRLVYPYFRVQHGIRALLSREYPALDIYPPAYPNFEIYPGHVVSARDYELINVQLVASYPTLVIYPAVYPDFEVYPGHVCVADMDFGPLYAPVTAASNVRPLPVKLSAQYPSFNLYPAVYPHFSVYPQVVVTDAVRSPQSRRQYPAFDSYTENVQLNDHASYLPQAGRLPTVYPAFNIYPAVYPALVIYPEIDSFAGPYLQTMPPRIMSNLGSQSGQDSGRMDESSFARLSAVYPSFDLYPAVYPDFDLYPALPHPTENGNKKFLSVGMNADYPVFSLYPSAYPHFDLYPLVDAAQFAEHSFRISTTLAPRYPIFSLFPAVYPYFEIYPGEITSACLSESSISTTLDPGYPFFDIYPAIYPYFDIYRSGRGVSEDDLMALSVKVPAQYPAFSLYSPVYPHFELWPSVGATGLAHPTKRSKRRRTHAELLQEVLSKSDTEMHGEILEQSSLSTQVVPVGLDSRSRPKRSHLDLHGAVFEAESLSGSLRGARDIAIPSSPLKIRLPSTNSPSQAASSRGSPADSHDIRQATPPYKMAPTSLPPVPRLPNTASLFPPVNVLGPLPRLSGLPSHPAQLLRRTSSTRLPPVEEDSSTKPLLHRSHSLASHMMSSQEGVELHRLVRQNVEKGRQSGTGESEAVRCFICNEGRGVNTYHDEHVGRVSSASATPNAFDFERNESLCVKTGSFKISIHVDYCLLSLSCQQDLKLYSLNASQHCVRAFGT